MFPSNQSMFAPTWVRCAASLIAILVLPFHLLLAHWAVTGNWMLFAAAPFSAGLSYSGLDYLMCGRRRESCFRVVANLITGKILATSRVGQAVPDGRSVSYPRSKSTKAVAVPIEDSGIA